MNIRLYFCGILFFVSHVSLASTDLLNQIKNNNFDSATDAISAYEANAFSSTTSEEALTTLYDQLATALKEEDLTVLNDWIAHDPGNHIPYLLKGMYFYELGWRYRGKKYLRFTPEENIQKMHGAFSLAEKQLLKAIAIYPNAVSAYENLIGLYFANGNASTKGKAIYEKGIVKNPDSVEIRKKFLWFLLPKWGVSYEIRKHYVDEIERASQNNERLKLVLAHNYAQLADEVHENYELTAKLYDKAMSYGYQCSIHKDEAFMMFNYKHYQQALNELNGLIDRCPNNASAYLIRARTVRKLGDKRSALSDLDTALLLSPGDPQILGTRGFFHIREKNYREAITDLSNALSKNQKIPWMWDNRGYAYYKLEMYDEAISDFTSTLQVDSGYKRAYRRRGNTYKKLHKYDLALQDYSAGLEVAPDNVSLLLRRAKLYFKELSNTVAALKDVEHVLRIEPKNKKAKKLKSKINDATN
ncbi:MAG: tetratricopeptide repeat protein [Proteobacteria bacterium]|nr:tetratricopeptide repeat protein [Pseudomonadota bacterium]